MKQMTGIVSLAWECRLTVEVHRSGDHEVCGIKCRLGRKLALIGVHLELCKLEVHVNGEIDCHHCGEKTQDRI